MSTIQNLFQQAQLAEAAYADFSVPGVSTKDALIANKFSVAQATAFVAEWRVINQIPDTTNGFSATVFERLDANQQPTGQYSFAIRGSTQVYADFVVDAGIIASAGIANAQVVDMYNYWQRLNTPVGAIYQAAVLVPLATGEIDQYSASQRIYDAGTETFMTIKFVGSNTLADATLRIKGVSIALFSEQSCRDSHASS